jgi:hypothetical protein
MSDAAGRRQRQLLTILPPLIDTPGYFLHFGFRASRRADRALTRWLAAARCQAADIAASRFHDWLMPFSA